VIRIVALLSVLAAAQAPLHAERLPLRAYAQADGLPNDQIRRVVRDSHGFLWFCTRQGLSRFDGHTFVPFGRDAGLSRPDVYDILERRDGTYLLATGAGVVRFDPRHAPRSFAPLDDVAGTEGRALALLEDRQGRLWIGTQRGLVLLDESGPLPVGRRLQTGFVPQGPGDSEDVLALAEDAAGGLWIGTDDGLVHRSPAGVLARHGRAAGLPSPNVRALWIDRDGTLWVGTTSGLAFLPPAGSTPAREEGRLFRDSAGLPRTWVFALFGAKDGTLWAGFAGGLARLSPPAPGGSRSVASFYTVAHGLSDPNVIALAEDLQGNLWLGTESSGAMRLAHGGLVAYGEDDGLPEPRVAALGQDHNGSLWAITADHRIHRFVGARFVSTRPNIPEEAVRGMWGWNQIALEDRDGDWWFSTAQGIYRFAAPRSLEDLARARPKAIYTTRDGLPSDEVFRLFEDSHGDIWIATLGWNNARLARWDRATRTVRLFPAASGLPLSSTPTEFEEDGSGGLWIGFDNGEIFHYREGRFSGPHFGGGPPRGMIRALHLDRSGRLWIATQEAGVLRIDAPDAAEPRTVRYTAAAGMSSDLVSCITEDRNGRIYVGTSGGIDRIEPTTGRTRRFSGDDGLPNPFVNVSFADDDGTLWFGTLRGLARLDPVEELPTRPPEVRIGALRVGGVAHPLPDLGVPTVPPLSLAADAGPIEVEFFGIGEALRYEYRLEGTQAEWSAPTWERTLHLVGLGAGSHRIAVRAVGPDGSRSPEAATVAFTIRPPLWRQAWFLGLVVLLVAGGVFAWHRVHLARVLALERVRTRIATDLHDDIGASLSQIAIVSEVVLRRIRTDDAEITGPLATIANVSREAIDTMSDIVWAINPRRDRLVDLAQRMRRFASDTFVARGIELRFESSDAERDPSLDPAVRRQVFLIFKEAVANAARHSGCSHAAIRLAVERGRLALQVRDDGHGFDPAAAAAGEGLESMRARAVALGGELRVDSIPGQGTELTLSLPLVRRRRPRPT